MTNQVIQFLLHQLANNEQDRGRFNKINEDFYIKNNRLCSNQFFYDSEDNRLGAVKLEEILEGYEFATEKFIRTCLSRVNGEAVLGVFEVKSKLIVEEYYEAFDYPLRNGKPLDEALQALHDKMLELVPEYVEFLNNNK
jgi:hypothetical protein